MAQMISVKCTSCGSQRKVPENAAAGVSCRKCGAAMAAPQEAAPVATKGRKPAASAGARRGAARGSRRQAAAGGRKSSRRQPAQPAEVHAAGPGRGRGVPAKPDNTPILVTVIVGIAVLVGGFFLLANSGRKNPPTASGSTGSEPSAPVLAGETRSTLRPWEVSNKFRTEAQRDSGDEILSYFDAVQYARARRLDAPTDTALELRIARGLKNDLPTWIREVFLKEEDERSGATADQAIVIGQRNRKPAIEFYLSRAGVTSPWKVYDFKSLDGGVPTQPEPTTPGVETVAPTETPEPSAPDAPPAESTAPKKKAPADLAGADYLAHYSNTTKEDIDSINAAIKGILSGDPRAEDEAFNRFKEVGQRSIPLLIGYLRSANVDDHNFREVNTLLHILAEISPGDEMSKPHAADLMSGQDKAVRNRIREWVEWWKGVHTQYRE